MVDKKVRFLDCQPGGLIARRQFMRCAVYGSLGFFTVQGVFAEELMKTPHQTQGPFYPNKLPLDTDNDLIILNDSLTPAVGKIVHLSGRVLDTKGDPIRNAVVEIWQVDNKAAYLHTRDPNHKKRDTHFQGYGRFLTSSTGEYYFRTIKPVSYPGRTPHIHIIVKKGEKRLLTTQCYIKGHPLNERDGILRSIRDPKVRDTVLVDFLPIEGIKTGEMTARFDIVLGVTPHD